MIPVGVLAFSLLVGLAQRYLRAPNVIRGGFTKSMKGEAEATDYRTFPGALVSAFASLLSGASIGPEGCVSTLVQDISAWMREKLKIPLRDAKAFDGAALASAFNGILGSPLWTSVLATEIRSSDEKSNALSFLAWNMLAGVVGFIVFASLGLPSFASSYAQAPISGLNPAYFVYAIILGLVGALLAVFSGVSMRFMGEIMERTFKDKVITRIMAAAVVIAVVSVFVPEVMFSGEEQLHQIIVNAAEYGVALLLLFAVLKILLLALSFKSGFLGGPIFPILFSSTMVAYAIGLLFPGIPISILVTSIEASAFTLALGAPLTAILLVAIVNTTNPYATAIIVLATVTGIIVSFGLKRLIGQHSAL
jgi:H+/Cl- antiporter ClcA